MANPADHAATAACGAYLLTAKADARIELLEETRFFGGIVNEPAFQRIEANALTSEYARLHQALSADFGAAEREILAAIGAIKADPDIVAAVKSAARNAIIADQKLKPQEELILVRIARALGIPAEEL
ncbi:MAG: hypothetical protein U5J99_10270 [Parvularculaceae bacterium]|nr:hypothetical protein [Parvularculaceae bacterium]